MSKVNDWNVELMGFTEEPTVEAKYEKSLDILWESLSLNIFDQLGVFGSMCDAIESLGYDVTQEQLSGGKHHHKVTRKDK